MKTDQYGNYDANRDLVDELQEAICENRRADALDIVAQMFPKDHRRTLADWHRLFPTRIPAQLPSDRTA